MISLLKAAIVVAGIIIVFVLVVGVELLVASRGAPQGFQNPSHAPQLFGHAPTTLTYVVLGDSTAAGQGADYQDGIAVSTAQFLAQKQSISLINFGVSGARLQQVLSEQLPLAIAQKPDIVLISASANDVTHLTPTATISKQLRQVIEGLIASNCHVQIVLTGAPEMGSVPRFAWPLNAVAKLRTGEANAAVEQLATSTGVAFAPIAKETGPAFKRRQSQLFSADRFHPNAAGYRLWTDVLTVALARPQAEHCQ